MAVDTSLFSQIIEEHLDLKRRNSELDGNLPLDRYMGGDPFENHPLFKTEEQARLEETMEAIESTDQPAVAAHAMHGSGEDRTEEDTGLWGRSRDFDWGD